jgi:hypothetical protein
VTDKLARQKDVQGALSLGGATLGLSALSAKGASIATNRALSQPKGKHSVPRVVPKWVTPQLARRLDKGSIGLVTLGAGVGGIGGYNFAAIQRAEAKREREPMSKSAFGVVQKFKSQSDRDSYYDRQSKMKAPELGTPDPDDWKREPPKEQKPPEKPIRRQYPTSGGIDPERRRLKRLGNYQDASAAGSVAAAAGAGGIMLAPKAARKIQSAASTAGLSQSRKGNVKRAAILQRTSVKAAKAGARLHTVPKGKIAIGAGLASAALAGTSVGVNRYRKKNGRSYTDWWDG